MVQWFIKITYSWNFLVPCIPSDDDNDRILKYKDLSFKSIETRTGWRSREAYCEMPLSWTIDFRLHLKYATPSPHLNDRIDILRMLLSVFLALQPSPAHFEGCPGLKITKHHSSSTFWMKIYLFKLKFTEKLFSASSFSFLHF